MKSLLLTLSLLMCLGLFGCFSTPTTNDTQQSYNNNEYTDSLYPRVPGHVPDATKTADTDLMCWAMVSCNQLAYAGYIVDENECVANMLEEFGNVPNTMDSALNFYFSTHLDSQLVEPDIYQATYGEDDGDTIGFLMNQIDNGNPVALSMYNRVAGANGHVVLVLGYWMNEDEDEIDLYLVDGDDNVHTGWMTLTYDGEFWPITGGDYTHFEVGYALTVLPYVAPVEAVIPEVTFEWDVYLQDFPQQNKTRETSNLCWAMSSCEVLYYQGFADSTSDCAAWMLSEYGNRGYAPVVATTKYLKEHYEVDSFVIPTAHAVTPLEVLAFVVEQLDNNDPAVLTTGDIFGGPGHAVSVYGYTDDGTNVTLLVRDSNDGIVPNPPLRHIVVNKNTAKITGTYERSYLGMAFSVY